MNAWKWPLILYVLGFGAFWIAIGYALGQRKRNRFHRNRSAWDAMAAQRTPPWDVHKSMLTRRQAQ